MILLGKRSVLMLSHDVDWEFSFQPMLAFADFEKTEGTSSTFFVQTKYRDDATSRAFYFGQSLDILRRVAEGSDIGPSMERDLISTRELAGIETSKSPEWLVSKYSPAEPGSPS